MLKNNKSILSRADYEYFLVYLYFGAEEPLLSGINRAYWAMTQLPPYIQLFALVCGAAFHNRRLQRIGHYRSWRTT